MHAAGKIRENVMREVKIKSAYPPYMAAACFLIAALFFPMYKLLHYVMIAAVAVAAYLIGKRIFPDKTVMVEQKVEVKKTGDAELDALMAEGGRYLEEMKRANRAIPDAALTVQIDRMEGASQKILQFIGKNPTKASQIRKFMNYYLPTSVKLLRSYAELSAQGVRGENIESTLRRIEKMLSEIADVFDKQLDRLFADDALDIATDIEVMQGMLAREGLADKGFSVDK